MDPLIEFIDFNENIDFGTIFAAVGVLYSLFLITVASLTARDAYIRFNKWYWGVLWFFIVLVLNLLGVIMYLLVGPEDEFSTSNRRQNDAGGVHIPVANFTGDDGEILLSFQLKVNSMQLADQVRDMRIDIDWESQDEAKELSASSIEEETKEVEDKLNRLKGIYDTLKNRLAKAAETSEKEKKAGKEKSSEDKNSPDKKESENKNTEEKKSEKKHSEDQKSEKKQKNEGKAEGENKSDKSKKENKSKEYNNSKDDKKSQDDKSKEKNKSWNGKNEDTKTSEEKKEGEDNEKKEDDEKDSKKLNDAEKKEDNKDDKKEDKHPNPFSN